jgi:hypothetical protein
MRSLGISYAAVTNAGLPAGQKKSCSTPENDAREDGGFAIRKEGPPSFYAWGGESRITLEPKTLGYAAPSWFD